MTNQKTVILKLLLINFYFYNLVGASGSDRSSGGSGGTDNFIKKVVQASQKHPLTSRMLLSTAAIMCPRGGGAPMRPKTSEFVKKSFVDFGSVAKENIRDQGCALGVKAKRVVVDSGKKAWDVALEYPEMTGIAAAFAGGLVTKSLGGSRNDIVMVYGSVGLGVGLSAQEFCKKRLMGQLQSGVAQNLEASAVLRDKSNEMIVAVQNSEASSVLGVESGRFVSDAVDSLNSSSHGLLSSTIAVQGLQEDLKTRAGVAFEDSADTLRGATKLGRAVSASRNSAQRIVGTQQTDSLARAVTFSEFLAGLDTQEEALKSLEGHVGSLGGDLAECKKRVDMLAISSQVVVNDLDRIAQLSADNLQAARKLNA